MGCSLPNNVVRISSEEDYNPVESSISINPQNPENIAGVGMQVGMPQNPSISNFSFITFDGGKSWAKQNSNNPEGRIQGDDLVKFGLDGTLYHSYIAFLGLRETDPAISKNGIFLETSPDGGKTWTDPIPVVDHPSSLRPFEDKPYLAVDNTNSTYSNRIYLSWTRFDGYQSQLPEDSTHIYSAHSSDGGISFSKALRVSDQGGDCMDSDDTLQGASTSVGLDGTVNVVWSSSAGLMFDQSTNGGVSFGKDQRIYSTPGGWDIEINGIGRHNGMPVLGSDLSAGSFSGSIYVSWIDTRNGDPDVFLGISRDNGKTWSEPLRVNGDDISNGKEQFFSWMSVDPMDGSINVVYYDRASLGSTQTLITLARSVDGGSTFNYHPIDLDAFSTNADLFFGDYIGVDSYDGTVVATFPHFLSKDTISLSAARFRFLPGTQTRQDINR